MFGQERLVDSIIIQQGNAAAAPFAGKNRDARGRKLIDIPVDGPAGNSEPLRQFPGGDALFVQEDQCYFQKPVDFHLLCRR